MYDASGQGASRLWDAEAGIRSGRRGGEMTQHDTMKITIVQESEHFVLLRPPRMDTRPSELLEDLEFIVSRGFRSLSFTKLFDPDSGLEENVIACEKLTK